MLETQKTGDQLAAASQLKKFSESTPETANKHQRP
jgi:hypothetical protein